MIRSARPTLAEVQLADLSLGSFSHNWPIWERVIAPLASAALDVRPIIGGVRPLEKWHEAFEKMHSGPFVKRVLAPA